MSHAREAQHDHPDFLAHHWSSAQQQFEAGKLGMWLFLATEVLLFGGLFVGYAVWRGNHPELFRFGSQYLDTTLGAVNTAVLILSSLTMAAAVTAAQRSQQGRLKLFLILTLAGAATFLVIKYFEYSHKIREGWVPGISFYEKPGPEAHTWQESTQGTPSMQGSAAAPPAAWSDDRWRALPPVEQPSMAQAAAGPAGMDAASLARRERGDTEADAGHGAHLVHALQDPNRPATAHMFFNIYFMMTGLHGLHVFAGGIVLTWLLVASMKGRFSSAYFTPVDLGGLYWHVVDLIWIFLFPLFYLI